MEIPGIQSIDTTPAQKWLLHYFSPSYEWYDRLTFILNRELTFDKVEKALFHLLKRHDGLRVTFFRKNKHWMQRIHLPEKMPIRNRLLIERERITHDEELSICREFTIEHFPLFKVIMVKKSSSRFQFTLLFHHIIVDYISVMVFFQEFCSLLQGISLSPSYLTNSNYVRAISEGIKREKWGEAEKFWSKMQTEKQKIWEKPCLEKNAKKIRKRLSKEQSKKLLLRGKKSFKASSLHEVVSAPLYKAMAILLGEGRVTISHKLHGRNIVGAAIPFFSAVGNYAINVPISCVINRSNDWLCLVHNVKEALESLPFKGLSYDILRPNPYPDHLATAVRINYMGNISFGIPLEAEIDFQTLTRRLFHPEQPLTTFIEFFIYFCEDVFFIDVCYDAIAYADNWIDHLTCNYLLYMNCLISKLT